jgi:SAM-dependent methyltransferase
MLRFGAISAAKDWIRLGQMEPYYAVLSNPGFKLDRLDDPAMAAFYATGLQHVARVLEILRQDFGFMPQGTALDFGCGVGRIAAALAAHFDAVVGLDISPGMVERANTHARAAGIHNVSYDSSLNDRRLAAETYEFVHSYIVLQHVPVKTGMAIIAALLSALKPGGVGAIHVTYATAARLPWVGKLREFVKKTPFLRQLGNIITGRPWDFPAMQMNHYNLPKFFALLTATGVSDVKAFMVDDWGSLGMFVFFKKPDGTQTKEPWSNPVRSKH